MTIKLLELVLPVLLGPLTFVIVQGAKRVSAWLDATSPLAKRVLVVVVAWLVTWVAHLLGVDVACDAATNPAGCVTALDHDTLKALLAAAIAFVLHALKPKATRDPVTGIEVVK